MLTRPLTDGERRLVTSMFGDAVDCDTVTVRLRKWFPFHPRTALMAPMGHIHAHPAGALWSEDYSVDRIGLRGLFLHEMVHVWQAQTRGRYYLPLMRHPFCKYRYTLVPDRPFGRYGIEQQAEIVRHAFLLRRGYHVPGSPTLAQIEALLPF